MLYNQSMDQPIHEAAERGDPDEVKRLIREDAAQLEAWPLDEGRFVPETTPLRQLLVIQRWWSG